MLTVNDGSGVSDTLAATPVDLLLLDLQMPGMNGFEVIRSLRHDWTPPRPGCRAPKILVISGRNEDDTMAFVRRLGADGFVTKPLWAEQLLATVRDVLGH